MDHLDIIMSALFLIVGVGVLGCNIGVLWITTKLYTEVLKVKHIDGIGKPQESILERYGYDETPEQL